MGSKLSSRLCCLSVACYLSIKANTPLFSCPCAFTLPLQDLY